MLDDLKETTGYGKLKEALDRTICRTLLGRGYGRVVRQCDSDVIEALYNLPAGATIGAGAYPICVAGTAATCEITGFTTGVWCTPGPLLLTIALKPCTGSAV